jgi:hypothetical protein
MRTIAKTTRALFCWRDGDWNYRAGQGAGLFRPALYATGIPGNHVHGALHRNYSDRRYYAYAPDGRMRHGTATRGITPSRAPVSRTGATETTHK